MKAPTRMIALILGTALLTVSACADNKTGMNAKDKVMASESAASDPTRDQTQDSNQQPNQQPNQQNDDQVSQASSNDPKQDSAQDRPSNTGDNSNSDSTTAVATPVPLPPVLAADGSGTPDNPTVVTDANSVPANIPQDSNQQNQVTVAAAPAPAPSLSPPAAPATPVTDDRAVQLAAEQAVADQAAAAQVEASHALAAQAAASQAAAAQAAADQATADQAAAEQAAAAQVAAAQVTAQQQPPTDQSASAASATPDPAAAASNNQGYSIFGQTSQTDSSAQQPAQNVEGSVTPVSQGSSTVGSNIATGPEVIMYCEPLTCNGILCLKTPIMQIPYGLFTGVTNPLHCSLRFSVASNVSIPGNSHCKSTYLGTDSAGNAQVKVNDIPCSGIDTFASLPEGTQAFQVSGCNTTSLLQAAYAYNAATKGSTTCNTYTHGLLERAGCAQNVVFPHDAAGWDTVPTWLNSATKQYP